MENINTLIVGIFFITLAVAGLIFAVLYIFSDKRQISKTKLAGFKQRYARGSPKDPQIRRVFSEATKITTVEQLFRRIMPNIDVIKMRLAGTGRNLTIAHYMAMIVVSALIVFLFLLLFIKLNPLLAFFAALVVGFGLPHKIINTMVKNRIKAFITLFPDALDLLVRGLRSGLPITESINAVAKEVANPVGGEFRKVMDQIMLGKNLDEALENTAERIDAAEFKFFVISLAIQRETGGNLAETLAKLSDLLRRRQSMKLKIKAMSSEGKASAYIVGALPFVMFFMLLTINYKYTSVLFTDPRAMYTALGGLAWMAIGGFVMKQMINFEI
ncbi:MAG: type II secretion system F family protein [Proteobacteria bacterium]|nr:type II secretion system F family protein [Pseudomonadota bacterium]